MTTTRKLFAFILVGILIGTNLSCGNEMDSYNKKLEKFEGVEKERYEALIDEYKYLNEELETLKNIKNKNSKAKIVEKYGKRIKPFLKQYLKTYPKGKEKYKEEKKKIEAKLEAEVKYSK